MLLEVIRDSIALQLMFYVFTGVLLLKNIIKYLPNITEFIRELKGNK
jgi:hypothetical protein